MCGISGYLGNRFTRAHLEAANENLYHRGPDGYGLFEEGKAGLAHRRLSIIELSELGAQPYFFEDLVLSFNGEIYNYRQIREDLRRKGYQFQSDSDTEVVIKAYHYWKEECLQYFNGMFAFAVYDRAERSMFLSRDRLGIKPLYYSTTGGLSFASELKSLLSFGHERSINGTALLEYFRQGYISGKRSIYSGIYKLEPGTWLKFRKGEEELGRYWKAGTSVTENKPAEIWKEEVQSLMIRAFTDHMISDVPVGVFLSGGIDSSLLAAILSEHHGQINTFTIGFREKEFNEAPYARFVAENLNTRHTELILDPKDAYPLLEEFYQVYDEPFADSSGIPCILVSALARKAGMKVVLSADGGDELFGGYSRYPEVLRLYSRIGKIPRKATFGKALSLLAANKAVQSTFMKNPGHRLGKLSELLLSKDLPEFYERFTANQSEQSAAKLINRNIFPAADYPLSVKPIELESLMLWDLNYYLADDLLVKMDRATMSQSIEGRQPFLDHRLVELAFKTPSALKINATGGKWILRGILKDYLPSHLFDRKKQGFSIPLFNWFNSEFSLMCERYFNTETLSKIPVLNPAEIMLEWRKFSYYKSRGQSYNVEKIWRILSFLMWWEKVMDKK